MATKLTAHLPWPGLLGPHYIRGPDFSSQLRWTGLPLLPLLPMLPPGFLSGLSYTVLSREEIGFGSRDAGAASIPYLVTGGSLAQSQHLLQGLGYDLLPLVQKLSFPITEVKAKAQVKVPRAASVGWGGCWMTVQWRRASAKPSLHRRRPTLHGTPQKDPTGTGHAPTTPPPSAEWSRQESPHTSCPAQGLPHLISAFTLRGTSWP